MRSGMDNIRLILKERKPYSDWVIIAVRNKGDYREHSMVIKEWKNKPTKKTYEETIALILRCFEVLTTLGARPILDIIRELARAQVED